MPNTPARGLVLIAMVLAFATRGAHAADADDAPTAASPLHLYLGVDPQTGEFTKDRPATTTTDNGNPPDADATQQRLDDLAEAIADGGGLDAVQQLIGGGAQPEVRALVEQAKGGLVAVHLFLLAWPLGIVVSEIIGWVFRRRDEQIDAFDRRYHRRRTALRLIQAAAIAVMIGLSAWSAWLAFDISRPQIIAVTAGSFAALIASMAAAGQIRRLDRDTLIDGVRLVRHQQQELRRDLEELHRRLGRPGTPAANAAVSTGAVSTSAVASARTIAEGASA